MTQQFLNNILRGFDQLIIFSALQNACPLKKSTLMLLTISILAYNQINMFSKVEPNNYCRNLYKSNKYQCDVRFYEQLLGQLAELELWQSHQRITLIKKQVDEIKLLTIEHAKSLDETFDEHQAALLTEQIKQALGKLDAREVVPLIEYMNSLEGKSIASRVRDFLSEEDPKEAEDHIQKLRGHIHDQKMKTQYTLRLGLIKFLNGHKLQTVSNSYRVIIEKAMEELKKVKPLLIQLPEEQEGKILNNHKFLGFLQGTHLIYTTTCRMYEMLKAIDGSSNYKFKLNNMRLEINSSISEFNMKFKKNVPLIEEGSYGHPSKHVLDLFTEYLLTGNSQILIKIKGSLCFLCMGEGDLVQAHSKSVHTRCWNYLRYFTKK